MKPVFRKLIAAGLTIGFFAVVRPDHIPSMWNTALFSIMFYIILDLGMADSFPEKKYIETRLNMPRRDIQRWAETKVGQD